MHPCQGQPLWITSLSPHTARSATPRPSRQPLPHLCPNTTTTATTITSAIASRLPFKLQPAASVDMAAAPPPPPQWVLDLNSTPASAPKNASLVDPPGYTASLTKKERSQASKNQRVPPTAEEMDTLKMKKAWEVAIAPAKQLPMNAFGTAFRHL